MCIYNEPEMVAELRKREGWIKGYKILLNNHNPYVYIATHYYYEGWNYPRDYTENVVRHREGTAGGMLYVFGTEKAAEVELRYFKKYRGPHQHYHLRTVWVHPKDVVAAEDRDIYQIGAKRVWLGEEPPTPAEAKMTRRQVESQEIEE